MGLAMLGQEFNLENTCASAESVKRPPRLSVNGCIILQALLSMPQKACGRISDAILTLPVATLGYMAQDPSGSRVLETLLKVLLASAVLFEVVALQIQSFMGLSVTELRFALQGSAPNQLKRKLLLALEQHYVKMSKLGASSRLVEALFTWAGIPEKEVIVQSLVGSIADLQVISPAHHVCVLPNGFRSKCFYHAGFKVWRSIVRDMYVGAVPELS